MLYAEYSCHQKSQILYERDYSLVFNKEQKRNTTNRSGRESSRLEHELKKDLIVKREFHPTILLFLTLYLAVGLGVRLLVPLYITASLLFSRENYLGYLHVSTKITLITS
jgi:hypothetical protein